MRGKLLIVIITVLTYVSYAAITIKPLSSSCFCDVSASCDAYCCCDQDCSSTLIYNWNNYTLCSSDGYAIPLCSYYYNQPMHTHDLYQGLRLIYTIIKRLFCISKINFVDPSSGFVSSTTNSQINIATTTIAAINPNIINLSQVGNINNLPLKNSIGVCGQYALRDMNSIQDDSCRVLISDGSALSSNNYLSVSTFVNNSQLTSSSLLVYYLTNPTTHNSTFASSITQICTGNTCPVIKQIKLYFIKTSTSVTVDYSSSYLVIGNTFINGTTYVHIKYSYQFISRASNYAYSSTYGYSKNSLISLIKLSNGSYYKIFNPVNLAFVNTDGSCRLGVTNDSDQSNLISFKFGVNSVYSCYGNSSSLLSPNLKAAFDYVGSLGSSTTNEADFIKIDQTATINPNQNIQLIFYYISIGTQSNPQYQITKAALNPISSSITNMINLYVQYMPLSNSVVLNLPSPPVIDAYLPNDFLYPFYVA